MLDAHLEAYAASGLRTLVMGRRLVPEEEFNEWMVEYNAAQALLGEEKLGG